MKDIIVVAIVVAFFAICAAYVTWCERMLLADAPERVEHDDSSVGRAARTAGAADNQLVGVAPDAASAEAANVRRQ